jgi:multidrug efflux pump
VSLETAAKPLMITTFNGLPSVEIDTTLNKGYSMGDTIAYINGLMNTEFPDMQYQYTGNALGYLQSNNETLLIVILGILCVYFLLTILFRNLADPLIIMLTVPFSILGGCVTLWLFHATINLYSALGLITLIGLITKHGVLITQFANHELQKGASVTEAVLTATHHRFRPIIMTTLAMVFGALPLVFSSNIFYMSRFNLGVTLIGGLLVGTLFSLFIVPLVYTLIKKAEGKS